MKCIQFYSQQSYQQQQQRQSFSSGGVNIARAAHCPPAGDASTNIARVTALHCHMRYAIRTSHVRSALSLSD